MLEAKKIKFPHVYAARAEDSKCLNGCFTRQNTLQNSVLGILSVARFKTKSPAAQYSKDISTLRDYIYLEQMPILSNLRHNHLTTVLFKITVNRTISLHY